MDNIFWNQIEAGISFKVPNHIKNGFHLGGYCVSYEVFKTIDNSDIESVEKIVRGDLNEFFKSNTVALPYGSTGEDAFGRIYASNPSKFKFLPGDRKTIKIVLDFVNGMDTHKGVPENKLLLQQSSIPQPEYVNTDVQRSINLLNNLSTTAHTNLNRLKEGFRYDEQTRMISTYLRMICGRLGYSTIQNNLQGVLPCTVSTNRYIKKSDCSILEGEVRGKQLLKYLEDRGLPKKVVLSDDATRVVGRIQYDSPSNQIMGFALPIAKKTGMPIIGAYPARNAEEIIKTFSSGNSVSSFVIAIMAQPLADVPPFCVSMFGSDSKYTSYDVENRWKYITSELAKLGIIVLVISSDSDPKYNRVMRKLSKLGTNPGLPGCEWFACEFNNIGAPFYVQDPTHIGTKMRNFSLRFRNKKIPFGPKYFIELEHLYILLNSISKDQHLLTATTLNPTDRQNFSSVLRMCSEKVRNLLKLKVKNSQATVIYLQIMQDVLDSFMKTSLSPLERVEKIWYSVFILRIWKDYIKSNKTLKIKDCFLTSNCYSCIELNAHSLVLCLLHLRKNDSPSLFQPIHYSSQPTESTFRLLRTFSPTYSTVANCSVKETVSRVSKIQLQSEIVHSYAPHFHFLQANKQNDGQILIHDLPTQNEIINAITKCRKDAIRTAKSIGFKITNEASLPCDLAPTSDNTKKTKNKSTKGEVRKIMNSYGKKLTALDLKNVNLINYAEKHPEPDERSPFVKLDNNKVVKKSSLCWLLRNDYQKISSDRNRRVMTLTENEFVNKTQHKTTNKKQQIAFKIPAYRYKSKF